MVSIKDKDFLKMWGVNPDVQMHIYYDESNNCRKFWLDEIKQDFNSAWDEDFVLAGVATEDEIKIDFEEIRSRFLLQKNAKELKSKTIYKGKDFLTCLDTKATTNLLDFIDDYGLFIHYQNVNNFFYTIVEILDSITNPSEIYDFGFDYFRMKSVLYNMLSERIEDVISVMIKYSYPNIQDTDIRGFCVDLLNLLRNRNEQNIEEKFISGMLRRAADSSSLLFIQNNEDFVTQSNYAEFYFDSITTFHKAFHHFDEELSIQEDAKRYLATDGSDNIKYEFLKSDECVLIQVSDMIAGLFGRMFSFINRTPRKNFRCVIKEMNNRQILNAARICSERIKSNNKNKGFLHSLTSIEIIENLDIFLLETEQEARMRNLL